MTTNATLRAAIIEFLAPRTNDRVGVKQIARQLGYSEQTVTREISLMTDEGIVRYCTMNSRRHYYLATGDIAPPATVPNWKTAKEYKLPIQTQRRLKEIAAHRERFPVIFR
jgi:DNA-binding transcriptional regulator GbsR (MarR family)